MTPAELLDLLQEFHRETLDLFRTRSVFARSVANYDANNGYQQVLGRQDVHLRWLTDAIGALGESATSLGDDAAQAETGGAPVLIDRDIQSQQAFIDRWSSRMGSITNARNRKMLELILGEMKEHLRILRQAREGRSDVLGRHSDGKVLRGEVLPARPRN